MNNFLAYYNHFEHLRRITHVVNASLAELIPDCKATGKHLPWFKLINMNGRVYDPLTGQFLSPDNYVQAPDFTQSYNRYSYCFNNPLSGIDPSGMHGPFPGESVNTHHTDDFVNMWLHTDGGGYYYSGYSDVYYNSSGDIVTFDEVYNNFLMQDVVDYSNSFESMGITTGANGYILTGQGSQGNLNLIFNNSNQYQGFNYYDCTKTLGFTDFSGYDPGIINQSLWGNFAQSGGDYSFMDYMSFGFNAGDLYYNATGLALHNELYWIQKNGTPRLTRNIGNNYLLQRSYRITGELAESAKIAARSFAYASTAISGINMVTDFRFANTFDFAMGLTTFLPGVGWAISGVYFISNVIVEAYTGKSIGEHLEMQLNKLGQ